jgi:DamX protein
MNAASISSPAQSRVSTGLDPFVHGHGSKSYFETPAIRQRIDLVRHLVEFGRQIIVISGPPGAGKSAMLAQVCDNVEVSWRLLQFIGGAALNQSTLLSKIAEELEIPKPADKTRLLESVRRAIKAANARGETIILTIDDAHKLPSDTPSGLTDLAHSIDESTELKIIVAADPSQTPLVEHLQQGSGGQTLVHVVEVPRFNTQQTFELLKHRWNAAYGTVEIPLNDAEVAQIYQQSNGVPGTALVLARQVQIISDRPSRPGSDPARRYVIIGAALIGLFLLFAFFNAEIPSDSLNADVAIDLPTQAPLTEQALTLPRDTARKSAPAPTRSAPKPSSGRSPGTLTGTGLDDAQVAKAQPLAPRQSSSTNGGSRDTASATTEEVRVPPPAPPMADPNTSDPDTPAETQSKVQVTIRSATQVSEPVVPATAMAKIIKKPDRSSDVRPEQPQRAQNSPEPRKPAETQKAGEAAKYSIKWLLKQPNTGYVLQLFGGRSRRAAEKFIGEKEIGANSDLLVTEHAGGAWYVVVYKHYPDRIAAQRAIRELPANLAVTKPWSRPISSLK